ncbi:MAG: OmpA family protein [Elusimicrobia bacterium]|nr:OmpA family protein [Elusimicrobiota bacterium]
MKKLLSFALAAAFLAACTSPAKKTAAGKNGKAGAAAAGESTEAAPLPPGAEVVEASLRGSGFEADADIKTVRFDYDSAQLSGETLDILKANAAVMKERKGTEFLVAGHCDDRGTVAYNLALGQKRAKEVRDYYIRLGVDGRKIATISFGKEQGECSEQTEECWSKNRRAVTGVRAKAGASAQ